MSNNWPSERPAARRPGRAPKAKPLVPTDWVTGWVMTIFIFAVTGTVLLLLWPVAAAALDSFETINEAMTQSTRHSLS